METVIPGGPPDLIAYAWFQIGYRPRSSLVLVGLRGPRLRTGMVARIDLPPPRQRAAAAARLAAMVSGAGDDAAVALIVADPGPKGHLLSQTPLSRAVRQQVRRAGLGLLDVLAVGDEAYLSYLCRDQGCCPKGGFPLTEVMSTATAAQMVLEGKVLADGESDLVADVTPDPVPLAALPRRRARPATAEQREEWMRRWRAALAEAVSAQSLSGGRRAVAPARGLAEDPGWLALALEDVMFRDALLVTLAAPDEPDPFRAPSACMDDVLPRREVLRAGSGLLAAVARAAPPGRRAEALATLAWAGWWSGHGARARLLTAQALADQPGHRLAQLIGQLLVAAVPPPWVDQVLAEAEWAEW
jgi:hypothetical protein